MKISVIKKKNDPIAMRISIGGNLEQAYCVYRGDLATIKILLASVTEAIIKMKEEPPISDDEGKKYS